MTAVDVLRRVGIPGLVVAAVVIAFGGGALTGWMEPGPGGPATAGTTPPSTTTTSTAPPRSVIGQVEQDVVADLGADQTALSLDATLRRRRIVAVSPAAVAARHAAVESAWAPDQVARIETLYDRTVVTTAADPTAPSVTDATFVVHDWGPVTVQGTAATATVVGHLRLHEPSNVRARATGGYLDPPDRTWVVALALVDGRWKMEGRTHN